MKKILSVKIGVFKRERTYRSFCTNKKATLRL